MNAIVRAHRIMDNDTRPTPETDKAQRSIRQDNGIFVNEELNRMADFARKLERERDEAREAGPQKILMRTLQLCRPPD